ncbi:piggyBac transposable element-derived protein 4-like [Oryzias melastigma]|uniref:piggyBac transposable element-derived protein 4-like n=1 Tax=Oryzias melastigma TaxID=30732 RepID=UPI00168D4B69|nr:piggyBac transposable element-derived protein 4-like [Oryzias melastigma]
MAARRTVKKLTAVEVLALLQELPDVDSGDSDEDSFVEESEFVPSDSSDEDIPVSMDTQPEQPVQSSLRTRKQTKRLIIVEEEDKVGKPSSVQGNSSKFKKGNHNVQDKDCRKRRCAGEKSSSSQKRKRTDQKFQKREEKVQKRKDTSKNSKTELCETAKDGTVWVRRKIEDFNSLQPTQPTQTSLSKGGPTEIARRKVTSRLQSFLCLFTISMFMTIRDCTEHKARKTNPDWSTSVYELMAFVAVLLFRGAAGRTGAMRDSWSKYFGIPEIMSTMSRDRYKELMRYLRFDIKDTRLERLQADKFAAISDIWGCFVQNCVQSYDPGNHITVDEQLFPTKVRCPFLQYIASKPDKFGIKFWIAADLNTKYMCNAIPYLGKDPNRDIGERLADNVVTRLMEPFLDRGRTVTMDNFFTSLSLANRLLQHNTTLLGTVNKIRREVPEQAKNTKEREEFSTQLFTSGSALLTIYAAKKKKNVCLLSTLHTKVEVEADLRQKPNVVTDYNYLKCGVDVLDQKLRAYTVRTGTRRWPVAVFYNILDIAASNAHVLYKACTGSKESRRKFQHKLAIELRNRHMQEVAQEKERKEALREMRRVSEGKTTTCQVQQSCKRNRSTEKCAICHKYTCRKCRKGSPFVCKNC